MVGEKKRVAKVQRVTYLSLSQDSIKLGLKKNEVAIRKLKDDNLDTIKYFSSIGHHDDKQKRLVKAIKVCNLLPIGIPYSSFQG